MVRGTLGQQQMAKRFGDFPAFFAVLWGIGHKAGGERGQLHAARFGKNKKSLATDFWRLSNVLISPGI